MLIPTALNSLDQDALYNWKSWRLSERRSSLLDLCSDRAAFHFGIALPNFVFRRLQKSLQLRPRTRLVFPLWVPSVSAGCSV